MNAEPLGLQVLDHLPEQLLSVPAVLIKQVLARPTLIHLPGLRPEPLFLSILLHGDEDVGLKAIQGVLQNHLESVLPRALSIFVGNVDAAAVGVRYLPDQPDYNRVWPGSELPLTEEHSIMRSVLKRMVERNVAASIDLHNNTGRNPHYACVCALSAEHLDLAAMFSDRAMFFQRPKGVQTQAFSAYCPSITCECGPIGDATGVRAAAQLIESLLELDRKQPASATPCEFRRLLPAHRQLHVFRTMATWRIVPTASVDFALHSSADVVLRPDLDLLNFQIVPAGSRLASIARPVAQCVNVQDESGRDVTEDYFIKLDGELTLRRDIIAAMFTDSLDAIRKDCVGYFLSTV